MDISDKIGVSKLSAKILKIRPGIFMQVEGEKHWQSGFKLP